MRRSRYLIGTALTATIIMGMAGLNATEAGQEYVTKAKVTTLHQAPMPGMDGKEVTIKHFVVPPGFVGGRHYHPGPVFVYVLKGELTVEMEEGTQTFKKGEVFPESLNIPMRGKNLSASDGLEILVFQVGDVGKPMMIKVD